MLWITNKKKEQAALKALQLECLEKIRSRPQESIDFQATRLAAGRIQFQMAAPFLQRADKLVGWLVTGYAATLALSVSSYDRLAQTFHTVSLAPSLYTFFAVLFLYLVQRMFTDANLAAGEALTATESLTAAVSATSPSDEHVADMAARLIAANPWPWRNLAKRNVFESLDGDWDAAPRRAMYRSMQLAPFFLLGNFFLLMYGMSKLLNL